MSEQTKKKHVPFMIMTLSCVMMIPVMAAWLHWGAKSSVQPVKAYTVEATPSFTDEQAKTYQEIYTSLAAGALRTTRLLPHSLDDGESPSREEVVDDLKEALEKIEIVITPKEVTVNGERVTNLDSLGSWGAPGTTGAFLAMLMGLIMGIVGWARNTSISRRDY